MSSSSRRDGGWSGRGSKRKSARKRGKAQRRGPSNEPSERGPPFSGSGERDSCKGAAHAVLPQIEGSSSSPERPKFPEGGRKLAAVQAALFPPLCVVPVHGSPILDLPLRLRARSKWPSQLGLADHATRPSNGAAKFHSPTRTGLGSDPPTIASLDHASIDEPRLCRTTPWLCISVQAALIPQRHSSTNCQRVC